MAFLDNNGVARLWQHISLQINNVKSILSGKVDKVDGKGLSTNDFTEDDKTQLAYGGTPIVSTTGTGSAYTATIPGITSLKYGTKIIIRPHTANTVASPTLNVNGLGAKTIRRPLTNTTNSGLSLSIGMLATNYPVELMYAGTSWYISTKPQVPASDLYGNVPLTSGGTGASSSEDARTNLEVYSKTEVDTLLTPITNTQIDSIWAAVPTETWTATLADGTTVSKTVFVGGE